MSGDIKPCHICVLLMLAAAALAAIAAGILFGLTRAHSNPRPHFGTVSAPIRKPLRDGGAFVVTLAIGTPPRSYQLEVDTGSDLIWTQCFQESSSTFRLLACGSPLSMCAAEACPSQGYPCRYNYTYGDGGDSDWTSGILAMDTFTFGSTAVPGVAFGCSNASSDGGWNGTAGLVGLGRGRQSLVSQLGAGRFSYCLTPFRDTNSTSALLIGPSAALNNDTVVRSTPLIAGPPECMSSFYCLNLTGISLGTTMLSIPHDGFSSRTDGNGVIFVDSGTTFTSLVDAAYRPVRAAVRSLVALPSVDGSNVTGLDLCFQLPSSSAPPAMPSMTFHFSGADMVLPADNYMVSDSGLWCLAMEEQAAGDEMSIFGSYQQQNMHMLFDVENEMLSFAPAECSTL